MLRNIKCRFAAEFQNFCNLLYSHSFCIYNSINKKEMHFSVWNEFTLHFASFCNATAQCFYFSVTTHNIYLKIYGLKTTLLVLFIEMVLQEKQKKIFQKKSLTMAIAKF